METPVKILVVEDEMIIAAKISLQLSELGYEITGILTRGEEAILHVEENLPDLVLLDINLKGKLDGIETAIKLKSKHNVCVIFLTANADESTFNRAKSAKPAAFLSKPFRQIDLQRAIELCISSLNQIPETYVTETENNSDSFILKDRIFIRKKDKMIKLMTSDILYIEADRNYSRIFTNPREYLLSVTLKTIEDKLFSQNFIRVHRSYLININHIDEVMDGYVTICEKPIPVGASMREKLMNRIQTL